MRLLGWITAFVLAVGSVLYAGALLLAVEVGGFFFFSFFPDLKYSKTSPVRLYFEILISECRAPLLLATALLLFLLATRTTLSSKKSAERIEESFAVIEANTQLHKEPLISDEPGSEAIGLGITPAEPS